MKTLLIEGKFSCFTASGIEDGDDPCRLVCGDSFSEQTESSTRQHPLEAAYFVVCGTARPGQASKPISSVTPVTRSSPVSRAIIWPQGECWVKQRAPLRYETGSSQRTLQWWATQLQTPASSIPRAAGAGLKQLYCSAACAAPVAVPVISRCARLKVRY